MQSVAGPSTSHAISQDPAGAFDDLLECSICYTQFQRPLQLSCGHSYCASCVDRLCTHERGEGIDIEGMAAQLAAQMAEQHDRLAMLGFNGNERAERAPPHRIQHPPGLGGMGDAMDRAEREMQREMLEDFGMIPRRIGILPHRPMRPPWDEMRGWQIPRIERERERDREHDGANRRAIEIRCPECRRPTRVPPEGLPVNYRLQDMIARLNINKDKERARRGTLKCESCQTSLSSGWFFSCKTDFCTQKFKTQLCAMCAIRQHNGHTIDEVKLLTEEDIAKAKEEISLQTARAHQALERIENGFASLAERAKTRLGSTVQYGMSTFAQLASKLDNQIFTAVGTVQVSVDKAKEIANRYEALQHNIYNFVNTTDVHFADLNNDLVNFFKELGVFEQQIKMEPQETADIEVVDTPQENPAQQRPETPREALNFEEINPFEIHRRYAHREMRDLHRHVVHRDGRVRRAAEMRGRRREQERNDQRVLLEERERDRVRIQERWAAIERAAAAFEREMGPQPEVGHVVPPEPQIPPAPIEAVREPSPAHFADELEGEEPEAEEILDPGQNFPIKEEVISPPQSPRQVHEEDAIMEDYNGNGEAPEPRRLRNRRWHVRFTSPDRDNIPARPDDAPGPSGGRRQPVARRQSKNLAPVRELRIRKK